MWCNLILDSTRSLARNSLMLYLAQARHLWSQCQDGWRHGFHRAGWVVSTEGFSYSDAGTLWKYRDIWGIQVHLCVVSLVMNNNLNYISDIHSTIFHVLDSCVEREQLWNSPFTAGRTFQIQLFLCSVAKTPVAFPLCRYSMVIPLAAYEMQKDIP